MLEKVGSLLGVQLSCTHTSMQQEHEQTTQKSKQWVHSHAVWNGFMITTGHHRVEDNFSVLHQLYQLSTLVRRRFNMIQS